MDQWGAVPVNGAAAVVLDAARGEGAAVGRVNPAAPGFLQGLMPCRRYGADSRRREAVGTVTKKENL